MVGLRKAVAIVALLALGALVLAAPPRDPGGSYRRAVVAMWPLLLPLGLTAVGLALDRYWARWLGIAAGVAVLPWALAFTLGPTYGQPRTRQSIALAAAVALIVALVGSRMFDRYEGRTTGLRWRGPRMALVRWTVICNVASALVLYLFVAAYDFRIEWHFGLLGALLLGTVVGVLLLARQRTLGLILLGGCCMVLVPAGAWFVSREATYAGEAVLFGLAFAPAVITGWASLFVFGPPIWRSLRAD